MIKTAYTLILISLFISFCGFSASFQENPNLSMRRGKEVYINNCQNCHMENGEGLAETFPPLAQSDYLMKETKKSIAIVLEGGADEIVVNGKTYSAPMPAFSSLNDQEVADVLNYVRNTWGNKAVSIAPKQVKELKK